jgi:branched-subunit amino acid ABC-type transport system permease component
MLSFVAPPEIVLLGLIRGSATALTAAGLVLVWRSNRLLNFSTVAIGAVAGGAALNAFSHWDVPYGAAVLLAVAAGAVVGLVVEVAVVRRFRRSTRLVATVATIGLAQLLGGLDLVIGRQVFGENGILSGARATPLSRHHWNIGVVLVDGNHLLVLAVVPVVTAALAWFLRRTAAGIAVRGAAENDERARLLGIGVNRLQSSV